VVSKRASWPYRTAAVLLITAAFAVDIVAKLGPLGDWSATLDVSLNLLLILAAIAAIVIGERKDQSAQQSDPDNDY
jgi:hypothetical protein